MYPLKTLTKEQRLKAAFNAVHEDLSQQRQEHAALKHNMNGWILHLQQENSILRQELLDMKQKMSFLVEKKRLKVLDF